MIQIHVQKHRKQHNVKHTTQNYHKLQICNWLFITGMLCLWQPTYEIKFYCNRLNGKATHKSEDTHSISVDAATFWSADPLLLWLPRLGRLQTFNFNYYVKCIYCLLQNDQK